MLCALGGNGTSELLENSKKRVTRLGQYHLETLQTRFPDSEGVVLRGKIDIKFGIRVIPCRLQASTLYIQDTTMFLQGSTLYI